MPVVFKSIQLLPQHESLCFNYFHRSLLTIAQKWIIMYKQNIITERLLHFKTWLKIKFASRGEYSQHSPFHVPSAERRTALWDTAKSSCNPANSLLLDWCWWRRYSHVESSKGHLLHVGGEPSLTGQSGLIPQPLQTVSRAAPGPRADERMVMRQVWHQTRNTTQDQVQWW